VLLLHFSETTRRISFPYRSMLLLHPTVTTWAIMGAVWELFEASADGLGGAGAMRISYFLAENEPGEARIISLKVVFLGAIQAFCFSSIFLMIGPDLSVWLTKNTILQNMFYHLTGITAVTNFSMTFALTCWSLVGMGQGRFGIATVIIVLCRWLVVYPLAGIAVFRFHHEINSVSGAIAVGYATAGFALGCVLIRSDWKQLSLDAQEAFYPPDENGIPEVGEEAGDNDATGNEDAEGEDDSNSSSDTDSIIL
jgi:Na+-driven multidrug efflux pump